VVDGPPHQLVVSHELLNEVTRVLRYPRFQALYRMSDRKLLAYRQYLEAVGQLVELAIPYVAPLRDPADLMVLQTAEVGDADLLVTADPDFYDTEVLRTAKLARSTSATNAWPWPASANTSGNLESNDHP
jgi:putative PIN family toxin of toxin-antitoxin system